MINRTFNQKFSFSLILLLGIAASLFAQSQVSPGSESFNLVIVSGTPGGIMAAVAAARDGKTSVLLERSTHIGGLPANGLGATDIITRTATGGLFFEFVSRVKDKYVKKYGAGSAQVADCKDGYRFEPSVASEVFDDMIREQPLITVRTNRQFDAAPENLVLEGNKIRQISILNRSTNQLEVYTGDVFLDATYEGDLIAAANVPFFLGREAGSLYNEPFAGIVYKLWGKETQEPGSTNYGDNAIQAYNYRLCLTTDPALRLDIPKPPNYNREEYASIVEDVRSGFHSGIEYEALTPAELAANRERQKDGRQPVGKLIPEGMQRLTNKVAMPNNKTDANNQHRAMVSTDLPEENWPWPSSDWVWRDQFAERLKNYTLGLLYFGQHDEELPDWFRDECLKWGLSKDEFTDNQNFPRQVYVREGRRMNGQYLFKTTDATPVIKGGRPPLHRTSITASHYGIDSHATRKREKGKKTLEGFLSYSAAPYTVPFGVILPPDISNLLAPVPVSATHLGLATLRMEPCWMAMGQAAGLGASIAIDEKKAIQDIKIETLQDKLLDQQAVLICYKDAFIGHPNFKALQYFGLRDLIPDWNARLDEAATEQDLRAWQKKTGIKLSKTDLRSALTRGQALQKLYDKVRK